MRNTLQFQCERFIENRDAVKDVFRWQSGYIVPACAACYGARPVDADKLRACDALIRQNMGPFSAFRGMARPLLAALLAQEEAPETGFRKAQEVYGALRELFSSSTYLPLAALTLARFSTDAREAAARTRAVYECMKRDHRFLTSSEDCVFAALLGLGQREPEAAEGEAEACYERLRDSFPRGNGLQSLSHVLALGEAAVAEKCERTLRLDEELRRAGLKFGRGLELPVLGALALLPRDQTLLIADVAEADQFLAAQRGYGLLGPGTAMRRMHAALIVIEEAADGDGTDVSHVAAGLAGVFAAQQAALCAAIAASTAASAAAANS